jgi:prepilin-type processing-associated H-X9-DG protein
MKEIPGIKPSPSKRRHLAGNGRRAFTLAELLVVLGTVGILALVLFPALAGTQPASVKAFQCLENSRRLNLAWQLYAGDNRDRFVVSSDDGIGTAPYQSIVAASKNQGNNYAWTWSKMDYNQNNPYNWDTNADVTLRPLWQYVKDSSVYKCPADPSQITIGSLPSGYTGPYTNGSIVPRIRSYSMNFYLGGFGANPTAILGGAGPWAKYFPFYLKMSEIGNLGIAPGPNQTFVFIDERSDCINWGNFVTDFTGYPLTAGTKPVGGSYQWNGDMPASYHNLAANISFADGHAETHRWKVPSTYPPPPANGALSGGHGSGTTWYAPYSQDVAYMQSISARPH